MKGERKDIGGSVIRTIVLLTGFLLALPIAAQDTRMLRTAEGAYLGAAVGDIATSWGREELNPVLGRGQFGPRQALVSAGISVGTVVAVDWLGRRVPKMRRPLAVVMFVAGGARGAVAVRNWKQR